MNDLTADDRAVIDRLRAALDEVTATAAESIPTTSPDGTPNASVGFVRHLPTRTGPPRWIGVAAATVLLAGGAVWALAQRSPTPRSTPGGSGTSVPSPATFVPTTLSSTTSDPRSPVVSEAASPTVPSLASAPSYSLEGSFAEQPLQTNGGASSGDAPLLVSWDLAAGSSGSGSAEAGFLVGTVLQNAPAVDPAAAAQDVADGAEAITAPDGQAWFAAGKNADGTAVTDRGELVWRRADGSAWTFFGQHVTRARLIELAFSAQAGSGLPIVLPGADASVVTVGSASGESVVQAWNTTDGTGGAASGVTSTVQLMVVRDGSAPLTLLSADNIARVAVAGHTGRQGLLPDGEVVAVWDAGSGWWGSLLIPAALARGADGIIASLRERPAPVVAPGGVTDTTVTVPPTSVVPPGGTLFPFPTTIAPAVDPRVAVRTTGMLIQQVGEPPKLAFGLKESAPPQGGDVPLLGFDWGMVAGEQTMNGVTWSEVQWDLTGTFDGTTFTVASVVRHVDVAPPTLTTAVPVTGCTSTTTDRAFAALSQLPLQTLGALEWSPFAGDGHCGARLVAIADTPTLRAALAALPADVDLDVTYQIVPLG